MKQEYTFEAGVQLFPQDNGWHYVKVPSKLSKPLEVLADRGLIAVQATVGKYSWNTSLLPIGDGTHFVALPAKLRKKESIGLGDRIKTSFNLRER